MSSAVPHLTMANLTDEVLGEIGSIYAGEAFVFKIVEEEDIAVSFGIFVCVYMRVLGELPIQGV